MKELIQIIESLHAINLQMIEKDNFINNYEGLIDLFLKFIKDEAFTKSDIYLDLRVKYISPIEMKLQKLTEAQLTIEPENITHSVSKPDTTSSKIVDKTKQKFTVVDVKAPIPTDIYTAPKSRKQYLKKPPKVKTKVDTQTGNTSGNISNIQVQIDDDDGSDDPTEYIAFEYKQQKYYIENQMTESMTYNIVNSQFKVAGNIAGSVLTLLHPHDLKKSEIINLPLAKNINDIVFDNYGIIS